MNLTFLFVTVSHGDELDVHVYTHIRKQSSKIICSQMLTYRNNNTPPSMVTALKNTVKPNGTHIFSQKINVNYLGGNL